MDFFGIITLYTYKPAHHIAQKNEIIFFQVHWFLYERITMYRNNIGQNVQKRHPCYQQSIYKEGIQNFSQSNCEVFAIRAGAVLGHHR